MKLKYLIIKLLNQLICNHKNQHLEVTNVLCTIEKVETKCTKCNKTLKKELEL